MDINMTLAAEFQTSPPIVQNIIQLVEEKNTIPFIARYRKEQTGNMDDEVLRKLVERWEYLTNLETKKDEVKKRLVELGHEDETLFAAIDQTMTLQEIDDLYRPYRPKRRTRAQVAMERGLEPLAELVWAGDMDDEALRVESEKFLGEEVPTAKEALQGASDIIAERVSDDPDNRSLVKKFMERTAYYQTVGVEEDITPYEMYADHRELYRLAPGYRVLAMNRGEREKKLRVSLDVNHEQIVSLLSHGLVKSEDQVLLQAAIEDGWKRLMFPSVEREMRQLSTETAEEEAIAVFGRNLRPLLMQAPLWDQGVIALDPGFRTGCKVVALGKQGELLDHDVIYPTVPREDIVGARRILNHLVEAYDIHVIAIGNGTASRETEQFVADWIREEQPDLHYTIVNEAGASIYSASELAKKEMGEYDVTVRGAASIGRRLQDPLAELVKIHPRHLGVGQYQHDLNNQRLDQVLTDVVESCVNTVGVDLNTASPALMNYVAGISNKVAQHVVEHRTTIGRFTNRKQLLDVKGLGPKTFEQCAGFLRIPDGDEPLDNTAVHPESYDLARKVQAEGKQQTAEDLAAQWDVGAYTLKDIMVELAKPGRDPRETSDQPLFRQDVLSMDELEVGMRMTGQVRNVVDFGVFVDIGVKQDGLVHITELTDDVCRDPHRVCQVGDVVDVTIIKLDRERERIGLSMRKDSKEKRKRR